MWQFILIGDVVAMGFLIALVVWTNMKGSKTLHQDYMKIPLEDSYPTKSEVR